MLQFWELTSYIVTSITLPFAVFAFLIGKLREREVDEEKVFEAVNSSYESFLRLVIRHPDLKLRSETPSKDLSPDQMDRIFALFEILISVLERGHLYLYSKKLRGKKLSRWQSWEEFIREWCRREDFRAHLPRLIAGEKSEFAAYITRIAEEESQTTR